MEKLRISIAASVFVFFCMNTAFAQGTRNSLLQQAVKGTLQAPKMYMTSGSTILTKTVPFFSSGMLAAAQAAIDAAAGRTVHAVRTQPVRVGNDRQRR